jgi:hypothetical protein
LSFDITGFLVLDVAAKTSECSAAEVEKEVFKTKG